MSRRARGRTRYRVVNWAAYDRSLACRGDVTMWISAEVAQAWRGTGRRTYSDAAIAAALTVRSVYGLALRQTEGLVASLFGLMGLTMPVPDHTTLSRRGRTLRLEPLVAAGDEPIDLVVDSTGLRLYRASSWHKRSRGAEGRQTWRKLHIAVDPADGRIHASVLTVSEVHDSQPVPRLLGQVASPLARVFGDGAYDGGPTYQALAGRRQPLPIPQGIFRPRAPAVRAAAGFDPLSQRGKHVRFVAEHGRAAWERRTGYGRRNLVEAAFSRFKRAFGDRLRSRGLEAQGAEAAVGLQALNRITDLGMPVTRRVA